MERFNLHKAEFEYDATDPEGYRCGMARFGPKIGAATLGASIYEIPPGQSVCPYHYEHGDEEWLIALEGRPLVRHVDAEEVLEPGDVVAFVRGPEGAHKVGNPTDETIRVLMFSTLRLPSVSVYPDSDKIGVFTGDDRIDDVIVRRESGVGYYDREP